MDIQYGHSVWIFSMNVQYGSNLLCCFFFPFFSLITECMYCMQKTLHYCCIVGNKMDPYPLWTLRRCIAFLFISVFSEEEEMVKTDFSRSMLSDVHVCMFLFLTHSGGRVFVKPLSFLANFLWLYSHVSYFSHVSFCCDASSGWCRIR